MFFITLFKYSKQALVGLLLNSISLSANHTTSLLAFDFSKEFQKDKIVQIHIYQS